MAKFGELIKADVPVLLQFYAEWNEGSASMKQVLVEVAEAMGEQLKVICIDVEKNHELMGALRIKQVPTLMLYKSGAMIWRQTGIMDAKALMGVVRTL